MVDQVYLAELQLSKTNSSDTEAPFFGFELSISSGTVSTKRYDKRDDFDFDIVSFPFVDYVDGDAYLAWSVKLKVTLQRISIRRNC